MPPPTDSRTARLVALYREMPDAALQGLLADPELLPQSRALAQAEWQRRQAAPGPVAAPPAGPSRSPRNELLLFSGVAAGLLVLLWFVMPAWGFTLLLVIFVPTVLMPLGKRFPTWGKALAGVLALAPLVLGGWLWRRGELAWQGGDYRPLGTLISWAVLLTVLAACWSLAASLLKGALHRGSWDELSDELERTRGRQFDDLTRRH